MTETTNTIFDKNTEGTEVASTFSDSIRGRTILITGVNKAGIGFGIADAFASQSPRCLVLAGRSCEKVQQCIDDLHGRYPDIDLHRLTVDLSSQQSIRQAAKEVLGWTDVPVIDVVVNNAGIMRHGDGSNGPMPTTQDGLEDMFGINHIGHFLLTNLIMPKIIVGANRGAKGSSRIINISSSGIVISPFRASDLDWKKAAADIPENERPNFTIMKGAGMDVDDSATYIPTAAYCQSKTCNVLYSVGLNQRLFEKHHVLSLSINPGDVRSELSRNTDRAWLDDKIAKREKAGIMHFKTPGQAASTALVAACDPKLSLPALDGTGQYLDHCQIAAAPAYATDREAADKLWSISEDLVGEVFSF